MEFQEKLTPNLELHCTQTNVFDSEEKVVSVTFNFSFFGQYCIAIIHRDDIKGDWPSFVFTEAPREVADSFVDQLESEHWEKLVECFCRHVDNHNRELAAERSA